MPPVPQVHNLLPQPICIAAFYNTNHSVVTGGEGVLSTKPRVNYYSSWKIPSGLYLEVCTTSVYSQNQPTPVSEHPRCFTVFRKAPALLFPQQGPPLLVTVNSPRVPVKAEFPCSILPLCESGGQNRRPLRDKASRATPLWKQRSKCGGVCVVQCNS
ncbi:UNVERIFIED_CONTAM: hypothetical protein K2H54_043029 [Gekko kuhli]